MRLKAFKYSRSFAWMLSVAATIVFSCPYANGAPELKSDTNVADGYFGFQEMGYEVEDGFTLNGGVVTQIVKTGAEAFDPGVKWHLQCRDGSNNPHGVWSVAEHLTFVWDNFSIISNYPTSNGATLSYNSNFVDAVSPGSGSFGSYGDPIWEMSQDWGVTDVEGWEGYYDYYVQTDDVIVLVGYQIRNGDSAEATE